MITLPDNLKLEEENKYSVVLCHFISPTEFYIRLVNIQYTCIHVLNKYFKHLQLFCNIIE